MRLWRRQGHHDDKHESPDPDKCEHVWRVRDVSVALPGPYVCEVCDVCGALHLDGPDAITGSPSNVAHAAALHLESLDRHSTLHQAPFPPSTPRD